MLGELTCAPHLLCPWSQWEIEVLVDEGEMLSAWDPTPKGDRKAGSMSWGGGYGRKKCPSPLPGTLVISIPQASLSERINGL